METRDKRRLAEAIRRRFTRGVSSLGFARTKTTFWTRPGEHTVDFVHLHLFSYAPSFRVHCGIRVLNDPFSAAALNGVSSFDGWFGRKPGERSYLFDFADTAESVAACAEHLARFVRDICEPWFARFRDPAELVSAAGSPLDADAREGLRQALAGQADEALVAASRRILGLRG